MKILPMILLVILCMALAGCTGLGSVQRAVGMKPSWRVINDTEAAQYGDRPQCYGMGIYSPYVESCPAVIGTGGTSACYDLAFVIHLDELDGCVQSECILVPTTSEFRKQLCDMQKEMVTAIPNNVTYNVTYSADVMTAVYTNTTSIILPAHTPTPLLSKDLIRTTVCNSSLCSNITRMASGELVSSTCPETCQPITDRFDLPGNGTYHIIVKTYQPETDVVVQVEYQEFQSQDKFGNKAYYPTNPQSLGESDRFSDFETTRFLPPPGKYCAEYGKNIPSACTSADTRNLTLVLVTTKAHQGRITVELWKVA